MKNKSHASRARTKFCVKVWYRPELSTGSPRITEILGHKKKHEKFSSQSLLQKNRCGIPYVTRILVLGKTHVMRNAL